MKMLWRSFFLVLVNIAVGFISMFLILGEDVFWKLSFVDTIYSNIGTTTFAVFQTVFIAEFILIWSLGGLWIMGFFGTLWNLINRL